MKKVCTQCYAHGVGKCHACACLAKDVTIPLKERHMPGFMWYFNYPFEAATRSDGFSVVVKPMSWCNPNRNVQLDPKLVDIYVIEKKEVWNKKDLDRRVRPVNWTLSFYVGATFLDNYKSPVKVYPISMFSFVMNKAWAAHPLIKWVDSWLSEDPLNFQFLGPLPIHAPTPYVVNQVPAVVNGRITISPDRFTESIVVIEEVKENPLDKAVDECLESRGISSKRMRLESKQREEQEDAQFEEDLKSFKP